LIVSRSTSSEAAALSLKSKADCAANILRGALPPVDLRAVCFVRAILERNKIVFEKTAKKKKKEKK
jgi:hypothetical protein